MPRARKLGLEGIVSKRLGLALPLRPLAALGQEQESGSTGGQAGGQKGLGEMTNRKLEIIGHRNERDFPHRCGTERDSALPLQPVIWRKMGELRHEIRSNLSCVAVGSNIERRGNANAQTPAGTGVA